MESNKYKEVLERGKYKEDTKVKDMSKFKDETQAECRKFLIIELRTPKSGSLLITFGGFIVCPIYMLVWQVCSSP